jgi:predicted alpha/beta-hydrolase family hydrolase
MAIGKHPGAGSRDAVVEALQTSRGAARIELDLPSAPRSLLVLGHGAGGGVDAVDLVAVRDALLPARVAIARLTQPYRVAGRRAPAPANHLDEAFVEAVTALRADLPAVPLVVGGRSSGARVACRTARALDAAGVLALAFPLHPPGKPEKSRLPELDTGLPTLVVNGDRDPFGVPPSSGTVRVVVRPGERHGLSVDPAGVAVVVRDWFAERGWSRPRRRAPARRDA